MYFHLVALNWEYFYLLKYILYILYTFEVQFKNAQLLLCLFDFNIGFISIKSLFNHFRQMFVNLFFYVGIMSGQTSDV